MKDLLGGKGAGLAEMTNLGVPVPAGFTISTEACVVYFKNKRKYPPGLWEEVLRYMKRLEAAMGAKFGDPANPLLVSVRSGARASMPGMMDTVLNLGLNDQTVEGLAKLAGDRRFAFDSYRRFIQMYSNVVLGLDHHMFEEILDDHKDKLYGEFLINAQGEDVVAGIRTPQALTKAAREEMGDKQPSMEEALPEVFVQFKQVVEKLEKHYRDMQDIEFTVEQGRLYMLQTR